MQAEAPPDNGPRRPPLPLARATCRRNRQRTVPARTRPGPRVAESEGDTNLSNWRARWQAEALDPPTRQLLARDSHAFLHQSVSTPCLNAIAKAEGRS